MGRTVLVVSAGNMHLVLCCFLVYLSIASHSVTAADLDIYPEDFADELIISRIQQVLTEWRKKQLRILPQDHQVLPQFTYHFPEDSSQNYHNDFFAIPPSDPRYYQPDVQLGEDKRSDEDDQSMRKSDSDQVVTPITAEEGSWSDESTSEANEPQLKKVEDVSYVFKKVLEYDENIVLVAVIAGCGAAAAVGVIALSIGWYKLHSNSKAAADIEYPAYGVTGPNKETTPTSVDRRLAQSAQMYHYQHQKQQIIAMESNRANNERRGSVSEGDSDEENEEGDYTVYECPGLAATDELEVKNPIFVDDPTPAAGNQPTEEAPAPADKK